MRPEKRIDVFLKVLGEQWKKQGKDMRFIEFLQSIKVAEFDLTLYFLDDVKLLDLLFPHVNINDIDFTKNKIGKFLNIIKKEWKRQGPDLRFCQFMFNNGLGDMGGIVYHLEEDELIKRWFPDVDPATYYLWGSYGVDRKRKLPKYDLICNLTSDHIENILKNVPTISDRYRKIFNDVLEKRKKELTIC